MVQGEGLGWQTWGEVLGEGCWLRGGGGSVWPGGAGSSRAWCAGHGGGTGWDAVGVSDMLRLFVLVVGVAQGEGVGVCFMRGW